MIINNNQTRFPVLRSVVREDLAYLSDRELRGVLAEYVPDMSAEDLEFSFKNLGRSLTKAAPGIVSGALAGATTGAALGPYGMLAGAAIGAVGGGIASHNAQPEPGRAVRPRPQARPVTTQPRPVAARPRRPVNPPSRPVPAQSQSAGAAQLLQLLSRPEILQALMALALGNAGRNNIPVGATQVPTSRIIESIEIVAARLKTSAAPIAHSVEQERASYGIAPYDIENNVDSFLSLLANTAPPEHIFGNSNDGAINEDDYEFYDELDDDDFEYAYESESEDGRLYRRSY